MRKKAKAQQLIRTCPYCKGTSIIKKGFRVKKHEQIQLYYCKLCQKKFTPSLTKGKTFPLRIIIDALSLYNRLYSLSEAAKRATQQYGIPVSPQNISNWLADYRDYLPFLRIRGFVEKKYKRREILIETKLFHKQIYQFKYHRAKTDCILNEEFRHYKLSPLKQFLELIVAECPHEIFQKSKRRASEFKGVFNLDKVRVTPKRNFAVVNTQMVLQAVANNKERHQVLQDFMLINDSVTVAAEVPVLLDSEDIKHYQNHLGFNVPLDSVVAQLAEPASSLEPRTSNSDPKDQIITGHIDLVQIRNGAIHILDFKPSAKKQKPIDQLTIYALALSRLTGIRLFHFKCAWFDSENYYEFFPLHVVYKKKKKRWKRPSS